MDGMQELGLQLEGRNTKPKIYLNPLKVPILYSHSVTMHLEDIS